MAARNTPDRQPPQDEGAESRGATGLAPEDVVAERYVVRRQLGAGGMGEAWLAEDRILHRRLVLKRLTAAQPAPSDSQNATRAGHLLTEAKRAAAINSPHIAQVYDVCSHNGEWLVAMEFVVGRDLRAALRTPLEAAAFFSLAVQIAEAIEAAHASGILHCDIKPENIMVTEQGFVKVLDFGLARMMASAEGAGETVSLAGAGSAFAGTPGYMAPEVLRENEPTEQSDIFALGVVLYEMAGGKPPFKGKSLADSVQMTLTDQPAALDLKARGLPTDLSRVIRKALEKQPERRYATVRDLLVDLRACASSGTASRSIARDIASESLRGLPRNYVAMAGVAVLLVAALLAWWLVRRHYSERATKVMDVVPAPKTRLLAVLPFHVIPEEAQLSAYSEGLREAITSSLAQEASSNGIEVLAASEVRAHALKTPEEAHKELGADLAIDGSYQQFGNQVRISYEVSDATGKILRSETANGTPTDPFKLEDDVVEGVLTMLSVSAAAPAGETAARFGTRIPAAYDAYLRGVGYLRDFEIADNLRKAETSFREATRADPEFAAAFAGLGETQWAEYQSTSDAAKIALARASCEKALQLNPQIAEAQICQGTIDDGTGQARQAQREFEEALRLDPQSDSALNGLARTYEETEQPEQAEKVYQQAIEARPYYWANYFALANFLLRRADYTRAATVLEQATAKFPANSVLARRLGVAYFLEGKFDQAAAILDGATRGNPHAEAYMDLGQVYLHQKKWDAAIAALESAAHMKPNSFAIAADLADAYAWSGQPAKAEARYKDALGMSRDRLRVNAQDLDALMVAAYCSAALGQRGDALEYLSTALEHAPEDSEVNYYAARVYARLGDQGAARDWATKAIAHGYSKADIESAPDMKGVAPPG